MTRLNNPKTYTLEWGGQTLNIETGRIAKQAGGAVTVQLGETMVLVTATAAPTFNPNMPFLPLTVDYREKTYAAGKFPGGFFKREGRPSDKEVLTSRLIDRPIRPLFPDGYMYETQVIATVISADGVNHSDIPAMIGASAALMISDLPFDGPIAGTRVGMVDGEYVLNPTLQQLERATMDALIVAKSDSIVMVEGGGQFISESQLAGALEFAQAQAQPVLELQQQMVAEVGKTKRQIVPPEPVDADLLKKIESQYGARLREAATVREKHARGAAMKAVEEQAITDLAGDDEDYAGEVKGAVRELQKTTVRALIREGERVDGRDHKTVRPIEVDLEVLPRSHGSALFTRGETQALVAATLGTQDDQQKTDSLERETWKHFYLHYNFPPYSVGEVKFLRGPGRREIGHGTLAERALLPVLPDITDFPYTVRVVSEITESNGSSSMATVCGGSLALMDAGVPITAPVAGVAMGLIQEGDDMIVLTDILGDEDHLGDMDFKVAGTRDGITSFQMDIKIAGITRALMEEALEQARAARLHILDEMQKTLAEPRKELSDFAPRVITVQIPQDRIGDVIGPGGKIIRGIVAETGAKIDIEEDGQVRIYSPSAAGAADAKRRIEQLTKEIEPGEYFVGVVKKIVDFGAFVEVLPGVDGLVHISEIADERIRAVADVITEGERVPVVVLEVDPQGKIRLSRKRALEKGIEGIEQEQTAG